ncbi:MAG: hypothetical protein CL878_05740 [Dehalococcoidia bacterium]|nr:hypothetical protein [Dehalococcoidia bacterium]
MLGPVGVDVRKAGDTGVGRYVEGLLEGLARQCCPPALVLYGRSWDRSLRTYAEARRTLYTVRSGVYSPWQHLEFWRLLHRHSPPVFHAPHFTTPLVIPRPTKLLVTIHDVAFLQRPDLTPYEYRQPWRLLAYGLALKIAAFRADLILADTQAAARQIVRQLPDAGGKVRVLNPGVDLQRLAPSGRADPISAGGPQDTLLFVGTITARKGVHELLEAFARTQARRKGTHLVLVGQNRSAYARQAIQRARQLDIARQVIFAGPLPDKQLMMCYRRARAVVEPSHLEGFGFPVVEAMAAGIPCVASAIGPLQEVTDGAALLVPPGDVPALTDAVDQVCFDAGLSQELSKKGRERAAHFSLERMGEAAMAIYREAMEL